MHVPHSASFFQLPPSTPSHTSSGCYFASTTIWQNFSGKNFSGFLACSFINRLVYGAHAFCLLQNGKTTALKHFQIAWVKGKPEHAEVIPSGTPAARAAPLPRQQQRVPQGKAKNLCNTVEKWRWGRFRRASGSVL